MTFVPRVRFNVKDAQRVAIVASALCKVHDGRSRAGGFPGHVVRGKHKPGRYAHVRIFKMLVDEGFWPLRNIVKFPDEFRSLPPPRVCYQKDRKNTLTNWRYAGLLVLSY